MGVGHDRWQQILYLPYHHVRQVYKPLAKSQVESLHYEHLINLFHLGGNELQAEILRLVLLAK